MTDKQSKMKRDDFKDICVKILTAKLSRAEILLLIDILSLSTELPPNDGDDKPTDVSVEILPDGRLTTENAAKYLGLAEKSIAQMRSNGTGPKFIKRGRVFYYKQDLDEWLSENGRDNKTQ